MTLENQNAGTFEAFLRHPPNEQEFLSICQLPWFRSGWHQVDVFAYRIRRAAYVWLTLHLFSHPNRGIPRPDHRTHFDRSTLFVSRRVLGTKKSTLAKVWRFC